MPISPKRPVSTLSNFDFWILCHCFGVFGEAVSSLSAGKRALLDPGPSSSGTKAQGGRLGRCPTSISGSCATASESSEKQWLLFLPPKEHCLTQGCQAVAQRQWHNGTRHTVLCHSDSSANGCRKLGSLSFGSASSKCSATRKSSIVVIFRLNGEPVTIFIFAPIRSTSSASSVG